MSDSEDFVKCPTCHALVKGQNLAKHLRKAHIKESKKNAKQPRKRPPTKMPPATSTPWKYAVDTNTDISWLPYEPSNSNTSPSSSRDPRDYQQNLEKCPHGVLKSAICGICNPRKFRKYMGID